MVTSLSFSSSPSLQCHTPEELNLQQHHSENFKDDLISNTHAPFVTEAYFSLNYNIFQHLSKFSLLVFFKFLELSKYFILKINSSVCDTFSSPSSS